MKGYREVEITEGGRGASVSVAGAATECVGKGYIRDNQDAGRIRVRVAISAVSLGGGSLAGTLYHGPSADDAVVSTGKTINVTATGDYYFLVNESDTSLVPLMPYLEIRVASTGAATCTVSKCGLFKA